MPALTSVSGSNSEEQIGPNETPELREKLGVEDDGTELEPLPG